MKLKSLLFTAGFLSGATFSSFAQKPGENYINADYKLKVASGYMQMSHSDSHPKNGNEPILGVYNVYGLLSGNLSLPYTVKKG